VKAVEEGAVAMFTEDIRKSMRQDQSTLESRYANSTLLKRPKEMISIEYSRKKMLMTWCGHGGDKMPYGRKVNDLYLPCHSW
jgi:hypothetical protein